MRTFGLLAVGTLLASCLLGGCSRGEQPAWMPRGLSRAESKLVLRAVTPPSPEPSQGNKGPKPQITIGADLAVPFKGEWKPAVRLLGVTITPRRPIRGRKLTVAYHLVVLRDLQNDWGIFLHVAWPGRSDFLNQDHNPVRGHFPTRYWRKGQRIVSAHSFTVPRTWASLKMTLHTGFWRGNKRMRVPPGYRTDGKDRMRLAELTLGAGDELPTVRYVVRRRQGPVKLDGRLGEAAWKRAVVAGPLRDYRWRPAPKLKTIVRMLWDDRYLYLGTTCADPDLWGRHTKRDSPIYEEEVVELLVRGKGPEQYVEVAFSPTGAVFDTLFPRYRWRKTGKLAYDSGAVSAVRLDGTLNRSGDRDRGWTLEARIPLARLGQGHRMPPQHGDRWRANVYRIERPRRILPTALALSPVSTGQNGDLHMLSRFAVLEFRSR